MDRTLNCLSYNCRGFNVAKRAYIKSLLSQCDILFIQEHWLSDGQLDQLGSLSPDHLFTAVSGFDNSDVLSGRPYGGCAILWRRNISLKVIPVNVNSRRLCCLSLSGMHFKALCINVYMPYEHDDASFDEFVMQMSLISDLIERNLDCHILLGGDFNVDFSRDRHHTDVLNDFCFQNNLSPVVRHHCSTIDYTYNFCMKSFSTIDHFMLSCHLFDGSVCSASVIHDVDNTSDHDPVSVILDITVPRLTFSRPQRTVKPAWCKATDDHIAAYKATVQANLSNIKLPVDSLLCRDVHCCNRSHIDDLNAFVDDITQACLAAGEVSLPRAGRVGSAGHIPGWNDIVAPVRDKSIFWHNIWMECGRPRSGIIADIMRKTRASYHYAIRKVRRNANDIINEKFADALLHNRGRDFWSEARKLRRSNMSVSSVVDGISTADGIADLFASKYQSLYTSVLYDRSEMESIHCLVDKSLSTSSDQHLIVGVSDVTNAINKLKPGKSDGCSGLCSDYFKHAPGVLAVYISLLLSALLTHGTMPQEFLTSTVIPIPKGKGLSVTDAANYRGIALSSIFGKIFDLIVLHRFSEQLCSSSLQFGFKAKHSTSMCTMILKEVIAYYTAHGGSLYCTMLDATKAFDRVEYCKLFNGLLRRDIPGVYIRLLLNMYTNHVTRVSWNGICSRPFVVGNGVKQGGVISPILFCIYIDSLLCALQNSGVGCYIGYMFLGALAYADDIVLLAPTPSAMRTMLALCDSFADDLHIVFNAKKSKCIHIGPELKLPYGSPEFFIGDMAIEFVDKWPHLGHIISATRDDKADIMSKRNTLCQHINNVLCFFASRDPITKLKLMKAYCNSFYGSVLWDLTNTSIRDVCIAWRKGLRRIWDLPHITHCNLLPLLCDTLPLMDELSCRCATFITNVLDSDNDAVSYAARHGVYFSRMLSPIGRNALFCCLRYGVQLRNIAFIKKFVVHGYVRYSQSPDVIHTARCLLELLYVKHGYSSLSLFSRDELMYAISYLSTV